MTEMPAFEDEPAPADDPVKALALYLAGGELDTSTANKAVDILARRISRRYPAVTLHDAIDIVQDAITKVVPRIRSDVEGSTAAAYLVRCVDTTTIDHLRGATRHAEPIAELDELVTTHSLTDDDIAAMVDRRATAASVTAAFQSLSRSGDRNAFLVATYLLNEIESSGNVPSMRQVAAGCDLSHAAVAKILARLRSQFALAVSDNQ